MILRNAKILFNKPVSVDLYHMGLVCPDIAAKIQPGQFLMVRIQDRLDPLLRRPFAVHRLYPNHPPGSFEMLYKVVGRGTQLLTNMQAGDSVNLLGPLGRNTAAPHRAAMRSSPLAASTMLSHPIHGTAFDRQPPQAQSRSPPNRPPGIATATPRRKKAHTSIRAPQKR